MKNYYFLLLLLGEKGRFMYNPALKVIDEHKYAFHVYKDVLAELPSHVSKKKFNETFNRIMEMIREREDEFLCVRGRMMDGWIRLELADLYPPE